MTDATITVDTAAVLKKNDPAEGGVDAELVGRLVEQARAAGLQLTGEGGLLQQLTKRVLEAALDGRSLITLAMTRATRPARTAATRAMAAGARRS